MALVCFQFLAARCFICAIVTGIAFVLQGCSGTDDPLPQCDDDKFKAAAEPCLNAISDQTQTCTDLKPPIDECWGKAVNAALPCDINEDMKWLGGILDKKFPGIKTTFMDTATECMQKMTLEKECQNEQNWEAKRGCRKQAEEAAGGKWTESGDHQVHSYCPSHWVREAMQTAQPEYHAWFEQECDEK
jgi:hypothetical protein